MKRIALGAACALAIGGGVGGAALAAGPDDAGQVANATGTYDITVENLTSGQPLSPPLIVAHRPGASVWKNGSVASHVVAAIAEDANNAPALQLLRGARGVQVAKTGVDLGASAPAPIPPGARQTYRIRVADSSRLSLTTMLVNTNDGFTGLSSYRLRRGTRTMTRPAYDAGSEKNNQDKAFIPGPVGGNPFVRDPEGRVIRQHPGLLPGVGDLTSAKHGFNRRAVAKVTVSRAG